METSKNSTRQLTLDELIFLQEASLANLTAWPENEKERRTSATCGPRCCALFENAPRATSWGKTFAALLVGMTGWSSKRCALTWSLKGTPYNRSYFQLRASALRTEETECGLLPTPTTDERDAKYKPSSRYQDASHTDHKRLQGGKVQGGANEGGKARDKQPARCVRSTWQKFPTFPALCGGDDGLSKELDGITFPRWRRESIKAYGNAIVPQVALQIFRAIEQYENGKNI